MQHHPCCNCEGGVGSSLCCTCIQGCSEVLNAGNTEHNDVVLCRLENPTGAGLSLIREHRSLSGLPLLSLLFFGFLVPVEHDILDEVTYQDKKGESYIDHEESTDSRCDSPIRYNPFSFASVKA